MTSMESDTVLDILMARGGCLAKGRDPFGSFQEWVDFAPGEDEFEGGIQNWGEGSLLFLQLWLGYYWHEHQRMHCVKQWMKVRRSQILLLLQSPPQKHLQQQQWIQAQSSCISHWLSGMTPLLKAWTWQSTLPMCNHNLYIKRFEFYRIRLKHAKSTSCVVCC